MRSFANCSTVWNPRDRHRLAGVTGLRLCSFVTFEGKDIKCQGIAIGDGGSFFNRLRFKLE